MAIRDDSPKLEEDLSALSPRALVISRPDSPLRSLRRRIHPLPRLVPWR